MIKTRIFDWAIKAMIICLGALIPALAQAQSNPYENTTASSTDQISNLTTPCSAPLIRNISVADSFTIDDVNMGLFMSHTYRGDIRVILESPAGTRSELIEQFNLNFENYNVLIDDEAGTLIDTGSHASDDNLTPVPPPYENTVSPDNPLSVFDGENSLGTWTVEICDDVGGDAGTFFRTGLYFTAIAPPATADLSLSSAVSNSTPDEGDDITYTLTVDNAGPDNASGVSVDVVIPTGFTYNSDNGGGAFNSATGIWTLPSAIASGGSASLDIDLHVDSTGTYTLESEISASAASDPDSTPGNSSTTEDDDDRRTVFPVTPTPPSLSCPITQTHDWDSNAWPFGTFSQSYPGGAEPISIAFTGDTVGYMADFTGLGYGPLPGTADLSGGGLSPVENTLLTVHNWDSNTRTYDITMNVGTAGAGMDQVQFTIFDVDLLNGGTNSGFIDQLTITGSLSGSPVSPVLTSYSANQVSGNVVTGTYDSANADNDGNLTVTFLSPVDTIVIDYRNNTSAPANPGQQGIAIHDLTYCASGTAATLDYSDAPTSGTSYGDATHTIVSGTYLGAGDPDADIGALASANADGDDTDGSDDEDGVSIPVLTEGASTTLTATVAGSGGYLQGWIDWNDDGDFADSGEQVATDLQDDGTGGDGTASDGTLTFDVTPPPGSETTQTFARFRWSSTPALDSITTASDGEVEDYAVAISAAPPGTINCGTGTTATGSGFASSGTGQFTEEIFWLDWTCPGHSFFPAGSTITRSWDVGDGTIINATLTGPTFSLEPYTTGSYFQDALPTLYGGLNPIGLIGVVDGQDPVFDISFSATYNSSARDLDYLWADAETTSVGEQISVTTTGSAFTLIEQSGGIVVSGDGTNTASLSPGATVGTALFESFGSPTFSVLLDQGGLQSIGFGVRIKRDFSDAPTSGTSYGDATHSIVSGIYMGAGDPDADTSSLASANADGDDADGTDDEDGVSFPSLYQGAGETLFVGVAGTGGYLQGWIDWDNDGSFDAGDQVATDLQDLDADGVIMVPAAVPSDAALTTFARFRWSTASGLDSTASASDGEVEDYAVSVNLVDTGAMTCPSGYSLVSQSGNAGTVVTAAVDSTLALGTLDTAGAVSNGTNSARNNSTNQILGVQLEHLVPAGAPITISVAKNNAQGNSNIQTSDVDSGYATQLVFNTGTLDRLQRRTIISPAGGTEFMRFSRTAGSIWIDGVSYDHACAQAMLEGDKTIQVWDPTNAGLYAVPGNDVVYTITITNSGEVETDAIVLIDAMPAEVEFYNGDIDDGGPESDPVSFSQTGGAGLTFTYGSNVAYSNAGTKPADFASCTYTPSAGYDPNVTFICINPQGAMQAGDPDPTFSVSFRARIE